MTVRSRIFSVVSVFSRSGKTVKTFIPRPKISVFRMRRDELAFGQGKFLENGANLADSGDRRPKVSANRTK